MGNSERYVDNLFLLIGHERALTMVLIVYMYVIMMTLDLL